MRRLDRYVVAEVLGPAVVALVAYTGFMLIRGLFQFSDLLLQSAEPLKDTAFILGFSLPHIVVLTIPVSLLLGLLIGVGRLSADSELVAIRATGTDLLALYRPIGAVAVVAWLVTASVYLALVPRANQLLYEKKLQLSTFVIAQMVQPGVFSREVAGRRIFVEEASSDRRSLTGVIVTDASDPNGPERLTLARTGQLELEEAEGRLWLRLEDAVAYRVSEGGDADERAASPEQRVLLDDTNPRERLGKLPFEKQLRELTLVELLGRYRAGRSGAESRLALVEIHKKIALPAACLVFGLIGLPLGVVNRRGSRAGGFAFSVGIVLFYYVLLAGGEAKAIDGTLSPATAMWLPNILLLAMGLVSLLRIRRDRTLFELPVGWRLPFTRRPVEEQSTVTARRPEPRRRAAGSFLLDRYIARRFLGAFALVVLSVASLYVIIDFMEISDDIARNRPPVSLLVRYFEAILAPVLQDVVPYAFLVAALVTVAGMVRSSETVAILATGVSLFRAVASVILLAIGMGGALYVFSEKIVPKSAVEAERLRDTILGRPPDLRRGPAQTWFRGEDGRFFSAQSADVVTGKVTGLTLLRLEPRAFRLVLRVDGSRAHLLPGKGFLVEEGWVRHYGPDGDLIRGRIEKPVFFEAPEAARLLIAGAVDPRQMTTPELARYVAARRKGGADVSALATGLQQRFAGSASALLLTLLGLPFAFKYGKHGAVAGVGAALMIGLAYLAFSSVTVKLGASGSLPPLLAAWAANALFGIWAAWGLLGVRT